MIREEDLIAVGRIAKTHGVNGEMVITFSRDIPEWDDVRCIFLMMDSLTVPFFVTNSRPKSSESDLITLEGVESEKDAALLTGKTVYLTTDDLGNENEPDFSEGFYVDDLVGFRVRTDDGRLSGKIVSLESSTANFLFIIETDSGEEVLVPAAGEFIAGVNPEKKLVTLSLPDGLLD